MLLVTPGVSNVSNAVSNTLFSDCNHCTSPRLVRGVVGPASVAEAAPGNALILLQ